MLKESKCIFSKSIPLSFSNYFYMSIFLRIKRESYSAKDVFTEDEGTILPHTKVVVPLAKKKDGQPLCWSSYVKGIS